MTNFEETLNQVNISSINRQILINKINNPYQSPNSFLFAGSSDTGKTFIADKMIKELNKETIVFSYNNSTGEKVNNFEELFQKISNDKEQIILLDGLNYLLKMGDWKYDNESQRDLLKLIELINKSKNKILVITIVNKTELLDVLIKCDVIVDFELPNSIQKNHFIKNKLNMTGEISEFISRNSIGYNFKDLGNMLYLANSEKNEINIDSIKLALSNYIPRQLASFDISKPTNINFNNIAGRIKIREKLKRIVESLKNDTLSKKLCIKRNNLLLFHGQAGTGKTFMVKALAGEIDYKIINFKPDNFGDKPYRALERIVEISKKYKNCIVFIDEAEKLFEKDKFGADNRIIGEFNRLIDGIDTDEFQSIIILSVNDINRLGTPLKDRFIEIKFDLPEEEERLDFFTKRVEKTSEFLKIDIAKESFSRNTKNMSFRDMEKLWDEMIFRYLENSKPIDEPMLISIKKDTLEKAPDGMFG